MKHCSEIQLDKLLNNRLSQKSRLLCRTHLLVCAACRKNLQELKDDRAFLGEFRRGVLEMEKAHLAADSLVNSPEKQNQ